MPFAATRINLEIIMLSEVKSEGKKADIMYHLYMESKKNDTNELLYKTNPDSQT